MQSSMARTALVAMALLTPSLAAAGVTLAPIMRSWNHARRRLDGMLTGSRPYDPAAVTAAIRLYVADAHEVSAHITGTSAAARDFAARFEHFARDAEAAGAASGTLAEFRPHAQRLMGDCQACHAIYNN